MLPEAIQTPLQELLPTFLQQLSTSEQLQTTLHSRISATLSSHDTVAQAAMTAAESIATARENAITAITDERGLIEALISTHNETIHAMEAARDTARRNLEDTIKNAKDDVTANWRTVKEDAQQLLEQLRSERDIPTEVNAATTAAADAQRTAEVARTAATDAQEAAADARRLHEDLLSPTRTAAKEAQDAASAAKRLRDELLGPTTLTDDAFADAKKATAALNQAQIGLAEEVHELNDTHVRARELLADLRTATAAATTAAAAAEDPHDASASTTAIASNTTARADNSATSAALAAPSSFTLRPPAPSPDRSTHTSESDRAERAECEDIVRQIEEEEERDHVSTGGTC